MIYLLYVCVAIGVIFLSIKAADYVDCLEKKTNLSGAFIGGILLSAVTSLPELFTSISSTLMLDEPELCIGNILGSNLFNFMVLSFLILISLKEFNKTRISSSQLIILSSIFIVYISLLLNFFGFFNFEIATIGITSIIIICCYVFSFKYLANEDGEKEEVVENVPLSLKQIIFRFVITSIGIIILSICISYVTDSISDKLNLGKGIAGALFMGIATSLPEVTSSIALFKKKNYNIAIGNILGSNIFNLAILALTDILYTKGDIYIFSDLKTVILLFAGFFATSLVFITLKSKIGNGKIIALLGIIFCYIGFIVL